MPTETQLETIPLIPRVDIFQTGKWNSDVYSEADLDHMVAAFDKVGFQPPVKAGHEEGQDKNPELRQRLFGAPALGYVGRIYREGKKLFADLINVPKRFGELIKAGTYKRISSEIYWSYKDEASNITYPLVLKAVAFLGADIPALTSLDAIECMFSKAADGTLTYSDNGNEVRVYDKEYCCDSAYPVNPGMTLPEYLVRYPRKAKEEVGYESMSSDALSDRCGRCKFFIADWFNACSLVEGRIEPNDICDLFEAFATNDVLYAKVPASAVVTETITEEEGKIEDFAFCPTGKDGGVDNSCGARDGDSKGDELPNKMPAETWGLILRSSKRGDNIRMRVKDVDNEISGVLKSVTTNKDGTFKNITIQRGGKSRNISGDEILAVKNSDRDIKTPKGISLSDNQQTNLSKNLEADASIKEGDKIMAEENKNPNAELIASFNSQMATFKTEMTEQISTVKKEYEAKMSEKDALIEALKNERIADEKRIATIEFQKKQDEIRYFLREQNKEGRLAPVEESRAEALMLSLSDTRQVKYSQEGKDIEKSELDAFKEFITKRPKLFTEQSLHDEEKDHAVDNGSNMVGEDESTKKAMEYMKENPTTSMRDAYKAVWEKNPKLFANWQRAPRTEAQ